MTNNVSAPAGAFGVSSHTSPVNVSVEPALGGRNRLTCAFRPLLAIPHILLVGSPLAFAFSFGRRVTEGPTVDWGAGGGVFGAVAVVIAIIAWFAIVFGGVFPEGLWTLAAQYLRWRVRAVAYMTLLRDEYPPFGDGAYPVSLTLPAPVGERDRLTVAFRMFLVLPHIVAVWFLCLGWAVTTIVSWVAILFTGRYPPQLYHFAVGVLRWSTRVEAYMLLLRDEYPPFSLE